MNPPSLPYHDALGPVNILDAPSAKFSQPAKIHPDCPEKLILALPSGHPSKVKQSNRSGVGANPRVFLVLSIRARRIANANR
jgi:hypothetical protein